MHYTNGGKHVEGSDTTAILADVTCGNCIRTRAFKDAVTATVDRVTTRHAELLDAGFLINFSYRNYVTGAHFHVTSANREISVRVTGEPDLRHFATLAEFLAWITPLDSSRAIDAVINNGMTWVAAMDMVWADNDTATITPHILSNGVTVFTAKCAHGWETGFYRTEDDARTVALGHGRTSRPLYEFPVSEDAESAVKPFRTASKVKNTRQARRFRKGA